MSENISINYEIQIRIYEPIYIGEEEVFSCGTPIEGTILKTQSKDEAFSFFESLKLKENPIQKSIRYCNLPDSCYTFSWCPRVKPFFEARILKNKTTGNNTKATELVKWTWILKRYIDISYHCKITTNENTFWSKKIYHVPPILINAHECPSYIHSREANAFAYKILRNFLPNDSFKLKKITAFDHIDML